MAELAQTLSPFFQVPAEVRLILYSYMVPNSPVYSGSCSRERFKPIRDDGRSCCPTMLRVCRKAYNEMIQPFYGSAPFTIVSQNKSGGQELDVKLLTLKEDLEFSSVLALPFGIRFVRNLTVTINLHMKHQSPSLVEFFFRAADVEKNPSPGMVCASGELFPLEPSSKKNEELLRFIASPSCMTHLEYLTVLVRYHKEFFFLSPGMQHPSRMFINLQPAIAIAEWQAAIRDSLESNLHLLRHIRVSRSVQIKTFNDRLGYSPTNFRIAAKAVREQFNRDIEKHIAQHSGLPADYPRPKCVVPAAD